MERHRHPTQRRTRHNPFARMKHHCPPFSPRSYLRFPGLIFYLIIHAAMRRPRLPFPALPPSVPFVSLSGTCFPVGKERHTYRCSPRVTIEMKIPSWDTQAWATVMLLDRELAVVCRSRRSKRSQQAFPHPLYSTPPCLPFPFCLLSLSFLSFSWCDLDYVSLLPLYFSCLIEALGEVGGSTATCPVSSLVPFHVGCSVTRRKLSQNTLLQRYVPTLDNSSSSILPRLPSFTYCF